MKLYQINDAIEVILAMIEVDADTGEVLSDIPKAAYEALDEFEIDRKEKVLSIAKYIVGERLEGKAIKERAQEMLVRAKRHERRAEGLIQYVQMQTHPGEKFEDADVEVKWQKASHVEIGCAVAELPEQFRRTKVTVEPDKKALRDAIKEGEEIANVWIQPTQKVVVK